MPSSLFKCLFGSAPASGVRAIRPQVENGYAALVNYMNILWADQGRQFVRQI